MRDYPGKVPSPNPMHRLLWLPLLLSVSACADKLDPGGPPGGSVPQADPAQPAPSGPAVDGLRQHIETLSARAEHGAVQVTVQHLLVSFAGKVPSARRSRQQAEELTAELWSKISSGGDFDALVKKYTDDSYPGRYSMTDGAAVSGAYPRRQMAPAFGDVAWRLAVGEFGVAAFDPARSPFGWHIIKRIE